MTPPRSLSTHGLALALIFPSLALTRMPGWAFAAAYVAGVAVALWVLKRHVLPWAVPRLGVVAPGVGLGVVLLVLAAALWVVHPRIDTAGFAIAGFYVGPADMNNALDDALGRLFAGAYPYHVQTFLGQPITPMPGALLAAAPFHLLGFTVLQGVFWLAVLALLVARARGASAGGVGAAAGPWVVGVALLLSPAVLYHLFQGIDYVANGTYVLAALLLVLATADGGRPGRMALAAVVLGVALSSRLNFLILVPLVVLPLYRTRGLVPAAAVAVGSAAGFLAITLPFFLYDPAGFSPFHTAGLLAPIAGIPFSHLLPPLLAGVAALWLGWRGTLEAEAVARDGFVVQLVLIGIVMLASTLDPAGFQIRFAHFGMLFLPLGVFAFGPRFLAEALAPAVAPAGVSGSAAPEGQQA
jgi:hypothetical protein